MQERSSFFDEGLDRVQSAWSSVEEEFEKLQKNFESRRKQLEKETEKQVKWLRRTPLAKRVGSIREDAAKSFESNLESLLALLPVASNAQVKRLERKVAQLTRKVNALERAAKGGAERPAKPSRTNGAGDAEQARA